MARGIGTKRGMGRRQFVAGTGAALAAPLLWIPRARAAEQVVVRTAGGAYDEIRKGLVYEPFGGSGTTLIAAHDLGMRAAVVELDPRFADVILRRAQGFCEITPERVLPDGTTETVSFT